MNAVSPGEIARAMDCPAELLPVLPELVGDLDSLGCDPERLLKVLDDAEVPRDLDALDLGCGKGAFAVTLAERGHVTTGVDAFGPFVEAARELARRRGVADRCRFLEADIREVSRSTGPCGLVSLISVGRPFGSLTKSIGGLRKLTVPGGWILIEDSYRAASKPVPGFEEYEDLDHCIESMCSFGDTLLTLERPSADALAETEQALQRSIARRAERVASRHPELRELIERYVLEQERLGRVYETDLPAFIALLRRAPR